MKQKGVLLSVVILLVLCGLMVFIGRQRGPDFQEVLQRLETLPTSSTAKDLEQAGFLNLSNLQAGPVKEVEEFFNGNKQVLFFFTETKAGPVFRLFTFTHDDLLLVNTYFVQSKYLRVPNYAATCQTNKVTTDGITEVWLHFTAPPSEGRIPDWTDYLLYRYIAKSQRQK